MLSGAYHFCVCSVHLDLNCYGQIKVIISGMPFFYGAELFCLKAFMFCMYTYYDMAVFCI